MRRTALLPVVLLLLSAACGDDGRSEREVPPLRVTEGARRESQDLVRRAQHFLDAGAPEAAEPVLRTALTTDPTNVDARRLLALLLIEDGRLKDGVPMVRAYLAEKPRNVEMLAVLAGALVRQGDFAAAVETYRRWLDIDDSADEALAGLGRALLRLGDAAQAKVVLSRAERRRAGRADIRSDLGLALQLLGERDEAEAKQRDALRRDESYAPAWRRLGDVLLLKQPPDEVGAAAAYGRYLDLRPPGRGEQAEVLAVLYPILRRQAATDATVAAAAEERWQELLRASAATQIGKAVVEAGEGAVARELRLQDRLREHPDDVGTRLALADLLRAGGHLAEAAEAYDQVLAAGEAEPAVLAAAGAVRLEVGPPAAAVEVLTRAVRGGAEPPAGRHLAWALLLADRVEESIQAYERVVEAHPDDRAAWAGRKLAEMRSVGR